MSAPDAVKSLEGIVQAAVSIAAVYKTLREQGLEQDEAIKLTLGIMRPPEPPKDPMMGAFASMLLGKQ